MQEEPLQQSAVYKLSTDTVTISTDVVYPDYSISLGWYDVVTSTDGHNC